MNSSASISNYEKLGLYKSTASVKSPTAGEKNGKAIYTTYRRVRTPKVVMRVEERESILNGEPTTMFFVVGGKNERKFISSEAAQSFITSVN
jgi:hypothetical protein